MRFGTIDAAREFWLSTSIPGVLIAHQFNGGTGTVPFVADVGADDDDVTGANVGTGEGNTY